VDEIAGHYEVRYEASYVICEHAGAWTVTHDLKTYGPFETFAEAENLAVHTALMAGRAGYRAQVFLGHKTKRAHWSYGQDDVPASLAVSANQPLVSHRPAAE
jgi:hypothetical protein